MSQLLFNAINFKTQYAGTTSDTTSLKILTASTSDGVVWGTMRQHVLEVCDALGVHLMEEAPHMDTRATWQEAFLTNR